MIDEKEGAGNFPYAAILQNHLKKIIGEIGNLELSSMSMIRIV